MNYLLPAQTLLDMCDQAANTAKVWADDIDTSTLRLSVISIAEARSAVDSISDLIHRSRLEANLLKLLSDVQADSEEALNFNEQHANVWRALLNDATLNGLGATDRQVYATAMYEGLTVVEQSHSHTAALLAFGVHIHVL